MAKGSINERWEKGTPHDNRSLKLYKTIAKIDMENGDAMDFKSGGDGDNGETLMYLFDIMYETEDKEKGADTRCDRYSLARTEFEGVRFCRKDAARRAQAILNVRDKAIQFLVKLAKQGHGSHLELDFEDCEHNDCIDARMFEKVGHAKKD